MTILAGKSALVTGASRNLGRAIAQRLAASGALVAINFAANQAAADETLAAIQAAGGDGFLVPGELGLPGSAEAVTQALIGQLQARGRNRLDILVNNVGGGDYCDIRTTDFATFDKIIANNLKTPFFLTQALLPHLADGGRVINLSSAASRLALPEVAVYSMCKAAVDMFTVIMAKELGPRGITVNAVLPGFNETESNAQEAADPETRRQIEAQTTLGRFGRPSDIADVVHALASPDMAWVTGQLIEASGGFRL